MPATTPPGAASAKQIGHYQVLGKIGEGGMGEVYRARDTRLNREVALKLLPQAFVEDPYRMARFQREAQLLASLNHPKIAAIYGLEESGSTRALVMELVEGPTLAERIGRAAQSARPKAASASPAQAPPAAASGAKTGAQTASAASRRKSSIPLEEALPIAQQLAEALEYAHEHGIIHRDLKPANIKVTPDGCVKVLDFGLAKAMEPEQGSTDIANSPTLSVAMTQAGFIIGTAAYMAPEQAKGKSVDRRADIWAFGCVLYEMLAGQKAFEGETISDVLAAVIKSEPDWNALPPDTPPAIRRLIRRCLAKDPKQRLHDIGDARLAIEDNISGTDRDSEAALAPAGEAPTSRLRHLLPWTVVALLVMALIGVLAAWRLLAPAPPPSFRFTVSPPENADFVFGGSPTISPDGRTLAFIAQSGPGKPSMIWLRPLDSVEPHPVTGTEGALMLFWSPDGVEIGFFATDYKIKRVAVSGGVPQLICDFKTLSGATWNSNGVILFFNGDGIYRVSDTGGTPTIVLKVDPAHGVTGYSFPQFLPDGLHFLVTVNTPGFEPNILGAGSLDSKTVEPLVHASSNAALYAPPGFFFYLDQGTLMTRPFDAAKLRFTGPPVPIAQNAGGYSIERLFSVAQTGVLTYVAAPTAVQNTTGQMTWINRSGGKVGTVASPGIYSTPALSPEGTRLAAAVGEFDKQDIWIYDLKRGTASRLTFNPANDTNPSWSSDGSQILFTSTRTGMDSIFQKAADGLGSTQVVSQSSDQARAIDDVSLDGRYAIYDTAGSAKTMQLWALPLSGDRKPFAFVQGSFGASNAHFSPNSRYVAYTSTETGKQEVYVQTFPNHSGKWQISSSGGSEPMWRSDGKELFYLAPLDNSSDIRVMSVVVNSDSGAFQAGIPKELFRTQLIPLWLWRNIYVPSRDGQRFLMVVPAGQPKPSPITVIVNWPALLKK